MTGQNADPRVLIPQGGPALVVEIGLKEIYDQLVSLNTKSEVMIGDLRDLAKQSEDHEQRIRSLETKMADVREHFRQGDDREVRLRALEKNRWPMHLVTAVVALAAFLASIFNIKIGAGG